MTRRPSGYAAPSAPDDTARQIPSATTATAAQLAYSIRLPTAYSTYSKFAAVSNSSDSFTAIRYSSARRRHADIYGGYADSYGTRNVGSRRPLWIYADGMRSIQFACGFAMRIRMRQRIQLRSDLRTVQTVGSRFTVCGLRIVVAEWI